MKMRMEMRMEKKRRGEKQTAKKRNVSISLTANIG